MLRWLIQDLVKSDCIVLFLVLLASAIYKTFCEVPNFRNKTFKKNISVLVLV